MLIHHGVMITAIRGDHDLVFSLERIHRCSDI